VLTWTTLRVSLSREQDENAERGKMRLKEQSLQGLPVLRVVGEMDHSDAPALVDAAQKVLGPEGRHLFIDLSECGYIDSGGLSVLLSLACQVGDEGWLAVIGPGRNMIRLFDIVGLSSNPAFRTYSTVDEAQAVV